MEGLLSPPERCFFMDWKTIYITGRPGFGEDLAKNLERSSVTFMPGYNTGDGDAYKMYWIPEALPIGEFKRAIGAKTVLRYRLRFHLDLEDLTNASGSLEFTKEEKEKIERMRLHDAA